MFANGANAPMQSFYMYSMTLARAGFVVLNFDFPSQGQSEAFPRGLQTAWPGAATGPGSGPCGARRSCRTTQDIVRWFAGAPIRLLPAADRQGAGDPADNPRNPALRTGVLNPREIGLAGQSMGALTVSNYLWFLPSGKGADGHPLPPIKAAVGLSGFEQASAAVPYQMQTTDLDLPGPGVGEPVTDGPIGTKSYYDRLRESGEGDGHLELIIMEGGSHGDTSNTTCFPYEVWSARLSTSYVVDWFACHVSARARSCERAAAPRPHLSRAVASEQDPDGPAGPKPSYCVSSPPDKASVGQLWRPHALAAGVTGHGLEDCKRP